MNQPVIKFPAEIAISVYCGICGAHCCKYTEVGRDGTSITVSCPTCEDKIAELEAQVDELRREATS